MESIFLKSEPEWEIDPVDEVFSEKVIKVSSNVVHNWIKGIDYLRVLFFIIEPRRLKFGMRM